MPELPTVRINDVTLTEGNSGLKTFIFTVSLSFSTNKEVMVQYATADGTAKAGTDYIAQSGTLVFLRWQTIKLITINVIGDTVYEPNETFYVNLFNPVNATL